MLITRAICVQWKFTTSNHVAVLLIKILIFFSTTQQCSLVPLESTLPSDRIRGPTRFGKALNSIFPKLSLQNMRGFDHATILSPSFHRLRKERLRQWPPISVWNTTKDPRGVLPEKLDGGVRHASWNPYPISDLVKNLIPYFIQTWSLLEPDAWQAVTASTRLA